MRPLYTDVRFIEIFSKIVWPQSKAIRSSSYCPSYRGVRFIVYPLYRDSTVYKILNILKLIWFTIDSSVLLNEEGQFFFHGICYFLFVLLIV